MLMSFPNEHQKELKKIRLGLQKVLYKDATEFLKCEDRVSLLKSGICIAVEQLQQIKDN